MGMQPRSSHDALEENDSCLPKAVTLAGTDGNDVSDGKLEW